jgi:hypothetical protein
MHIAFSIKKFHEKGKKKPKPVPLLFFWDMKLHE